MADLSRLAQILNDNVDEFQKLVAEYTSKIAKLDEKEKSLIAKEADIVLREGKCDIANMNEEKVKKAFIARDNAMQAMISAGADRDAKIAEAKQAKQQADNLINEYNEKVLFIEKERKDINLMREALAEKEKNMREEILNELINKAK